MKVVQLGAKVGSGFGMGKGNAGDTAVGMACTNVYQNEFSNCEITYMNCRQIFEQKHVDEINKHDILIVGGGGLFLKDTFPNDILFFLRRALSLSGNCAEINITI